MTKFFIEAGINHFGKIKEANIILDNFLSSKFDNLTFMLKSDKFYADQLKLGKNFKLDKSFYELALKKCHKKNKKLGLAIGLAEKLGNLDEVKFDFYKLLSVGINNKKLIKVLKKKNKTIYISTGFNANKLKIKRCLNLFKRTKTQLLHTPMSYSPNQLNFSKINDLRKTFKIPVGYSNHHNNLNCLNVLSAYKPETIFIYCKTASKKGQKYPDDEHSFSFKELQNSKNDYEKSSLMHSGIKIKKVKIFSNYKN